MSERILVIDDDEELAELLGILFAKRGYETETALTGKDALDKLESFKPAVVVQDYMLPDIKGVDLLKEIRLSYPETYVVVVTARGSEDVAVEMLKSGASDYLKKPFDTDKLVNTVENILKLRNSESERYKLVCELQRQNRELLAINALSSALSSSMSRSSKCGSAVDIIMKNMRADLTNVFLSSAGSTSLTLQASHDLQGDVLTEKDFAGNKGLAYYIRESKKPAVVADIYTEKRIKIPVRIQEMAMSSALGVPMMYRDEFKGVLEVYTKEPRTFASFDIKLLSSFANLLALTLENENITASLEQAEKRWQATCDAMPDSITVQDSNHKIIRANKAAAELAGASVEDLLGQQCCWMFHSIKEPIHDCPVEKAFATRAYASSTLRVDGGRKTYQVEASPVFGEDGEIEMVVERARRVDG